MVRIVKIRVYSDLHLYINNDDINRYDLGELLDLKNLLYTDPVDMLIFAGDLTHKVYNTNDRRFVNTMAFISDVRNICESTNTLFRIIKGTSTHEGKVIDVLKSIYTDDKTLVCFTEVAYEQIGGLIFRYLPEPYFDTYNNFYNYAFGRSADITIFHGTIDGVIPYLKQSNSGTNLTKSVLMKAEDLILNTRLFSVGGHIHKHINIQGKIFYTNSLTTHNFSDVNDTKGFMEFEINTDDRNWSYKFIENYNAPKFISINIDAIHKKKKEDMRSILGNTLLKLKSHDKIRFVITGERNLTAMSNLEFVKTLTKKYNIRIEERLDDTIIEETVSSQDSDFYTDDNVSISEKIQKLIIEKEGIELSIDDIDKYIK